MAFAPPECQIIVRNSRGVSKNIQTSLNISDTITNICRENNKKYVLCSLEASKWICFLEMSRTFDENFPETFWTFPRNFLETSWKCPRHFLARSRKCLGNVREISGKCPGKPLDNIKQTSWFISSTHLVGLYSFLLKGFAGVR